MPTPRALIVVALALASASTLSHAQPAEPAPAEPTPAEVAQQRYKQGLDLFATQEFAQAIAEFRAAYKIDPQPAFLYSLAQAHRRAGDCASAIDAYRAYLRTKPPEDKAEKARLNISRCEQEIADARAAEERRLAAALAAKPRTRVERVGFRRAPWYTDKLGMGLSIAGVVSAGAAGGLLYLSSARLSDARDGGTIQDTASAHESAQGYRTASIVTFVGAGLLVTGGVIRFALRPARERQVSLSLAAGATGAALVMGGRF